MKKQFRLSKNSTIPARSKRYESVNNTRRMQHKSGKIRAISSSILVNNDSRRTS